MERSSQPDLGRLNRFLFLLPGPYVYEARCQAFVGGGSLFSYREPVEEAFCAAVLEQAGKTVRVIHAAPEGKSRARVLAEIKSFAPDAVFLSSSFPGHVQDLAYAGEIKKLSANILVAAHGGHMAHVNRKRLLERFPDLDVLVRGESEFVLRHMLLSGNGKSPGFTFRENGGFRETPDPLFSGDLDALPMPARHLLPRFAYKSPDTGRPMATITANRGCPHQCAFCLGPAVTGSSVRLRSIGSIVREVRFCMEQLGITDFMMRGETFTLQREWLLDLCRALETDAPGCRWVCNARADTLDRRVVRAMRSAGCWGIGMGAESASPATLARIGKELDLDAVGRACAACRDTGVATLVYFLLGFSWETAGDIRQTMRFARRLKSDMVEWFFPYPYPGTDLYEEAVSGGLMDEENPPRRAQQEPVFIPKGMSRESLLGLRAAARLHPVQVLRAARAALRQAGNPATLARILAHGAATVRRAF